MPSVADYSTGSPRITSCCRLAIDSVSICSLQLLPCGIPERGVGVGPCISRAEVVGSERRRMSPGRVLVVASIALHLPSAHWISSRYHHPSRECYTPDISAMFCKSFSYRRPVRSISSTRGDIFPPRRPSIPASIPAGFRPVQCVLRKSARKSLLT